MIERTNPEPSPEANLGLAKNFEVLTPEKFRQDFCNEVGLAVAGSPSRDENLTLPVLQRPAIGLKAMWIEFYNKDPKAFFTAVQEAAQTGFDVEVHRDWYSETLTDEDFLFLPPTKLVSKAQKAHRMWVHGFSQKRLDLLEDEGATIVTTNVPENLIDKTTYLFQGRDHKKIIFVKGREKISAWIGGMNLAQEHFKQLDFMVKIDDPRIVQALIEEFHKVGDNKRSENAEVPFTENTTLLIDAGKEPSLILKQAISDVDSALETIYVSSAFLPSGEFLDALDRAKKRGVHIAYITSNPDKTGGLLGLHGKISDTRNKRKKRIPIISPEKLLVHAKALVVDEKSVIIGSHNFVDLPHEELSLRSENTELVENVTEFLQRISGGNLDKHLEKDLVVSGISV